MVAVLSVTMHTRGCPWSQRNAGTEENDPPVKLLTVGLLGLLGLLGAREAARRVVRLPS
jgi:hypothetical protein